MQLITGTLSEAQQAQFLQDYAALFGAVSIVGVEPDTVVYIGGSYTNGVFTLPPQPESAPEIVEGTSELIDEPAAMIDGITSKPEATEPDL